jgi:hypothetical protein
MLCPLDRDLVEGFAVLVVARQDCVRLFNEAKCEPLVPSCDDRRRLVEAAPLRELRRLTLALTSLMVELGFSPRARANLTAAPRQVEDELDRFLTPLNLRPRCTGPKGST